MYVKCIGKGDVTRTQPSSESPGRTAPELLEFGVHLAHVNRSMFTATVVQLAIVKGECRCVLEV